MADAEICSVCERTILAGEVPRTYLTRDGDPRVVCDLCRPRAEAAGWTLEGRIAEPAPTSGERPRGRGRMRKLLDRARESAAIAASRPPREERVDGQAQAPARQPQPAGNGDGPATAPSRRHSVPQSPERRARRAFDRFNVSEHRRMVAGLIRSLGPPSVAAVASANALGEVRITVAWELAWYQWEVDISRDDAPLRELARGDEVHELPEEDKVWNAHAGPDGELIVGLEAEELAEDAGDA